MKGRTEYLGWSDHEAVVIELKMGEGIEWGRGNWKGHGGLFQKTDGVTRFKVEVDLWMTKNIGWEWWEMKEWCSSWWEMEDRNRRKERTKERWKAVKWLEDARKEIVECGAEGPSGELIARASWIKEWISDIDAQQLSVDK